MGPADVDTGRPQIRSVVPKRQKPRVDERVECDLAGDAINPAQALNLLRFQRQPKAFRCTPIARG